MIKKLCKKVFGIFITHKLYSVIAVVLFAFSIVAVSAFARTPKKKNSDSGAISMSSEALSSDTSSEAATVSQEQFIDETVPSEPEAVSSTNSNPVSGVAEKPIPKPLFINADYKFNKNLDPDNNVFLDSLICTGYNINKHRSDGNWWKYILAKYKRGMGYLSNITYGGGCSGYETSNGLPDIRAFERGGLVCASYATYVYFNFLPNVAKIDTSYLAKPEKPTSANDWYMAAKQWISDGYSTAIPFTASKTASNFINFSTLSDIPIGSILIFCDAKKISDYGSHVAIYAGYVNNYNWVYHVGNTNGPELCAVERMLFGPDPQWPIMVIATPSPVVNAIIAPEPVPEPVPEPATEPVTEPVTEPLTEPVTEPSTEPVTEPSAIQQPDSQPDILP